MKGDFSRLPFARGDRFTSVRQQQGRITLDSDWNEQASIREHLERSYLEDVFGRAACSSDDSFAVAWHGQTLYLSAGLLYVGGFRCRLAHDVPLEALLGASIAPAQGRMDLVYVNVWERHVTAIDDPTIREVALGGPDTTTRLIATWRIELLRDVQASCSKASGLMPHPSDGIMRARTPAGYHGVDNQLYRVEIHDSGTAANATFKWSRDNASIVFPIAAFLNSTSLSLTAGSEEGSSLAVGDWVEVSGVECELAGTAGTLAQVTEIQDDVCVLDRDVSRHGSEAHPRVRRWDQRDGPTLELARQWIELEAGIQIEFSEGHYRTGDYWTIPARPPTGSIEWPEDRPPDGIERRFAPLALLTWDRVARTWKPSIQDCRRVFVPLTDLYAELTRLREEVSELRKHADALPR